MRHNSEDKRGRSQPFGEGVMAYAFINGRIQSPPDCITGVLWRSQLGLATSKSGGAENARLTGNLELAGSKALLCSYDSAYCR